MNFIGNVWISLPPSLPLSLLPSTACCLRSSLFRCWVWWWCYPDDTDKRELPTTVRKVLLPSITTLFQSLLVTCTILPPQGGFGISTLAECSREGGLEGVCCEQGGGSGHDWGFAHQLPAIWLHSRRRLSHMTVIWQFWYTVNIVSSRTSWQKQ